MATTGTDPSHPLNNVEAGSHPLPDDACEIAAVIRAGERCYELLPYLSLRYGSRGAAYTRSDGGFLTTLISAGQDHVDQQVQWLAGVLASRGMPRWLMEVHLDLLAEELERSCPDQSLRYSKLSQAAHLLRKERWSVLPETEFQRLSRQVEQAADDDFRNCGCLVVSSVCDEVCGIRNAVPSLVEWLADTSRFPAEWCAAVTGTVEDVRAAIRQRKGGNGA